MPAADDERNQMREYMELLKDADFISSQIAKWAPKLRIGEPTQIHIQPPKSSAPKQ